MRTLLALAAIALLASGCVGTATDPTPSANPPAGTSSHPGSNPGAGAGNGNQGIDVGEPNPNAPGGIAGGGTSTGTLIEPSHAENESDGLRLVGDESVSGFPIGSSVRFTYVATNIGADATTWGGCHRPYEYTLRDANGTEHPLQVPSAMCLGFTNDPFPGSAKMEFNTTWDGRYAVGDKMQQAPAGEYHFTATFTAHGANDEVRKVSVTLPVFIFDGDLSQV